MTEEEINNLAEKHCNEVLCNAHEKCYEVIKCRDWRSRRAGFFCGYEQAVKDMQQENDRLAQHILELQKDKGELTDENNKLLDVINNQDVKIADLEEDLKLAEHNLKVKQGFNDNQYAYGLKISNQLEQATEIIKKLLGLYFNPVVTNEDLKKQDEIIEQAEQFLKEHTYP